MLVHLVYRNHNRSTVKYCFLSSWTPGKPPVDGGTTLHDQVSDVWKDSNQAVKSGNNLSLSVAEYSPGSSLAARIANRTLYQKRKHIWRSRRPVQCPNCQKVISMAYNLKSHLTTCLKKTGSVFRKS